jgi:hypothetical protein
LAISLSYINPQVSFVFVIQLILVNLVVAVILESYTEASDSQRRLVSSLTLQNFTDQWQLRDPDATGFIRMEKLGKLFKSVPPPLAFRGTEQAVSFGKLMPLVQSMELNIYMSSNKAGVSQYYVSFHELLMKLSARAMCARTTDKTAVHAIKQSVRLRTQQEIDKHAFKLRVIRSFRVRTPVWLAVCSPLEWAVRTPRESGRCASVQGLFSVSPRAKTLFIRFATNQSLLGVAGCSSFAPPRC